MNEIQRFDTGPGPGHGGGFSGRGRHHVPIGSVLVGLFVITLGVLFTLHNVGLVDAGQVLRWWPMFLVAFGLARLAGIWCRRDVVLGVIFTLAGMLFLLREVGAVALDPWDFWPVVLIVIGFSMLNGALRRRREAGVPSSSAPGPPSALGDEPARGGPDDPAPTLSTFALWSGVERKVSSTAFRGGDVTAIMGGADIDLRPARLEGGRAVLDVSVIAGGVELYVPTDWKVSVEAMPMFGSVEDTTQAPAGEVRGHLVVRGFVLMGGLDVKN